MNEVATRDGSNDVTEFVEQMITFDGPTGLEGIDRDCVTIPFLKVAQSNHDQTKRGSPEEIRGLEPGMFFCPATRKVYGSEVNLIILRFYRQYIVYDGEGTDAKMIDAITPEAFVRDIEPYATRVKSYHMKDGNRYVDTRNFIVMVAGALHDGAMLLSLSSTGISPSKKWLTQVGSVYAPNGQPAPIWTSVWRLATAFQNNPQGSYYQITRVDRMGWITEKAKPIVVRAFLDAQGHNTADIKGDGDMTAKPAPDQQMQADVADVEQALGMSAAPPTGRQPAQRQDDGPDIF